jgi:hypothetical protein
MQRATGKREKACFTGSFHSNMLMQSKHDCDGSVSARLWKADLRGLRVSKHAFKHKGNSFVLGVSLTDLFLRGNFHQLSALSTKEFFVMALTKKVRFELFKRDKFTCQYCGRTAPDIILHADHIEPKSKGGSDDLLNLLTSCLDCNLGKSDRRLDDASVLNKQKAQLDALQERRDQIEMMLEWQKELLSIDEVAVNAAADYWAIVASPFCVNENGKTHLRQWLRKFSLEEILAGMKASATSYLRLEGGAPTKESIELAFDKTPAVCATQRKIAEKPYMKEVYHVRNILKRSVGYINDKMFFPLMDDVECSFTDWQWVKGVARSASSWTKFYNTVYAEVYQGETKD